MRNLSSRKGLLGLLALGVLVLFGAGVAVTVIWGGRSTSQRPQPVGRATASARPSTPSAEPSREAQLPMAKAPFVPSRLMIRRLGIDARIEVKGIDAHNQMEAPDKPLDAAWYRFTPQPGGGGNAVFSGHLDAQSTGPAIFWRLTQLTPGDLIEVVSPQSSELRYRVTQSSSYPVTTIPMKTVLYPGGGDQITLITCAGRYQAPAGYDHRLVIRATKEAV
jgi:LPXTG-site transpeptidase (sortase) family protein